MLDKKRGSEGKRKRRRGEKKNKKRKEEKKMTKKKKIRGEEEIMEYSFFENREREGVEDRRAGRGSGTIRVGT